MTTNADLDRVFASSIAYPKQTPEQIEAQIAAAKARWALEDAGLAQRQTVYQGAEPVDYSDDDLVRHMEGLPNWFSERRALF